jgi:hypothetical protein
LGWWGSLTHGPPSGDGRGILWLGDQVSLLARKRDGPKARHRGGRTRTRGGPTGKQTSWDLGSDEEVSDGQASGRVPRSMGSRTTPGRVEHTPPHPSQTPALSSGPSFRCPQIQCCARPLSPCTCQLRKGTANKQYLGLPDNTAEGNGESGEQKYFSRAAPGLPEREVGGAARHGSLSCLQGTGAGSAVTSEEQDG